MVVVAIIGILSSLLAVAGFAFVENAKEAATATTITKIDEAILERVSAINRYHERPISRIRKDWEQRGWPQRWKAYGLSNFAGTAATSPGWADAAQMVLSRKGMMLETFPITQSELKQSYWFWAQFRDSNPADSFEVINKVRVPYLSAAEMTAMQTFLNDIDPDRPGAQTLDRPGEIFLYALKNAPVFGGLPMTADQFTEDELIDPPELINPADPTAGSQPDGIPELADSWGNPLRFYRWPTRLVNNGEFTIHPDGSMTAGDWTDNTARQILMPNAPSLDLKQDPDDRAGYLSLRNPLYSTASQAIPIAVFFHDMNTWHAPLVVSAGPDGLLGLAEPDENLPLGSLPRYGLARPLSLNIDKTIGDLSLNEQLFDNISNHNSDGGF